jgi:hypothetical protein
LQGPNGVVGRAGGFDERRFGEPDVLRHDREVHHGRDDVLRQGPVQLDAEDLAPRAEVDLPGPAEAAGQAADHRVDEDMIPCGDLLGGAVADRLDHARDLVAQRDGRERRRRVPFGDVDVRTAQADGPHAHQRLTGTGPGAGERGDLEGCSGGGESGRLHDNHPISEGNFK